MSQLLNFTPHPIHVLDGENNLVRTIKSSGLIRLKASTVDAELEVDGVKITTTKFGEPEGLPDFKSDVFYIVSQLVKSALPNRPDLLVPAEVQRDEKGNIIGCRSLGI